MANEAWTTTDRAGYIGRPRLSASLTAQNTFCGPTYLAKDRPFQISVSGTFTATVTLQKSYDGGSNWHDVESYTTATEKIVDSIDGATMWRLGVKTGGFGNGTAVCRIIQ